MASTSSAVALPGVEDELLAMLRAELTGEEQRIFVESFAAYLQHDQCTDFVIDLDDAYQWAGFTRKDNAKALIKKHLAEGKHYKISKPVVTQLLRSQELNNGGPGHKGVFLRPQENPLGGRPSERTMLTVEGFKRLCLRADTPKADRVHDYYIAMERALMKYTKRKMEQQVAALALKDAEHAAELAAATQQLTLKDAEAAEAKADLQRFLEKTYGECPKLDNIYIHNITSWTIDPTVNRYTPKVHEQTKAWRERQKAALRLNAM